MIKAQGILDDKLIINKCNGWDVNEKNKTKLHHLENILTH